MQKVVLAVACLACVGYGRRLQNSVQFDTELAAAFNPSSTGTRVSVSNAVRSSSRSQVFTGRSGLGPHVPATEMQATAAVKAPAQQECESKELVVSSDQIFGKPLVVGLSHHTASVEVREKLSIPEDRWNEASARLVEFDSIDEAAIISTCNRFEIYVVARDKLAAERDVVAFLAERSGLPADDLEPNLFDHWDEEATWHILRVASGLDSLVVGEAHIMAQMKAMFKHASSPATEDEPAGSAKEVLSRLMTTAIGTGKAVRTETTLGDGAVSISSAGVELAVMKSPQVLRRPLIDLQVAVVGAGVMSRAFLMNLQGNGLTKVVLLNRSPGRAETLADEFKDTMKVDVKLMDEFWPTVEKMDLVLTATSSVDPIITKDELNARVWGDGKTPLMLIDIAVPRNIEAACDELPNVYSYNVDDLKEVVAANQAKRASAILEAEVIMKQQLSLFQKWQSTVDYMPIMKGLSQKYDAFRDAELEAQKDIFADLNEKSQTLVKKVLTQVVTLQTRFPFMYLQAGNPDGKKAKVRQLKALFGLSTSKFTEADAEESKLYAPVWEILSDRREEDVQSSLTSMLNNKKFNLRAILSEKQLQTLEQMIQRILDNVMQDRKTYLLSHLVDSEKLSVDEVKEIFGIRE